MIKIKHLLTIICLLIGTTFMYAQSDCDKNSAYFCDDFESYDETMALGPQSAEWTTWSGNEGGAEDGIVTTDYANSGSQSMKIEGTSPAGGAQDVILDLGNQTTGRYRLRFDIYIPEGKGAYYNVQHNFDGPGMVYEWASQIQFFPDGFAQLDAGAGADAVFTYEWDTWMRVDQILDMDMDTASISVGGKHLHSWTFSHQAVPAAGTPPPLAGTNQLSALDFFPIDDTHEFYIDDIFVELLPACSLDEGAIICDDMEMYPDGDYIGPHSSFWSTWSTNEGTAEDGIVSSDFAASGTKSMKIECCQAQDVTLHLGERVSGIYQAQWMMYIPAGQVGYFNFHSSEVPDPPSTTFFGEFVFGDVTAGMGESTLTGNTFSYPEDTWFMVNSILDLDNELFNFWVDGVQVETDAVLEDMTLGIVDFFSLNDDNLYYIDDVIFKAIANDCDNASLGESTGPSTVCFGDAFSFDVGPSTIPQVNELGNLSGFEWGIFTADVSGSTDPFNDPALAGIWAGSFPNETFSAEGINDGSIFPPGVWYLAPIYFGNAVNTDGTIGGLDFTNGCVLTGAAVEVTFLAELEEIVANETSTNTTGGLDNGSAMVAPTGGAGTFTYDWDNGETTAAISDLAPGDYTCIITSTDNLGCSTSTTVTVTIEGSIAVEDIEILESLTVGPNPTRGEVNVNMSLSAMATVQMDITDITGKVVAQFNPENTNSYQQTIDLSHLANGLYFARITVDNDSFVKKIQLSK